MNKTLKMKSLPILCFALIFQLSCQSKNVQSDAEIKMEIQKRLNKCVEAVKTKNINLYMDLIPDDFILKDQSGEIISREKQKEYTLRDWSIIDTTLNNRFVVDSIKTFGDSVIAYTYQNWERLMFRQDGKTKDTIRTTQKHIETWKKTKKGWLNYEVQEFGGQIFINGKLYKE
jgi:hypothetical protein